MRKLLLLLIICLLASNSFAQDRLRLGISIGSTYTKPQVTHDDPYGKVKAGFGTNIYIPVNYSLNDKWSLESGAGYFLNRYRFSYDGTEAVLLTGCPYFPLKASYSKTFREQAQWFVSSGPVLQTAFAKGTFNDLHTDTASQVTTQRSTKIKPYVLITFEAGIKKFTQRNKIHRLSMQAFYGLETQTKGVAYHTYAPSSTFTFESKNHFITLQYTFWFGRHMKPGAIECE